MSSRKTRQDDEGWKRGAGAYSKEVKLNRPDPFYPKVLTDDLNPAADAAAKYSRNDDAGLRNKLPDEATAKPRDIYSDVCKNSLDDDAGGSRPGPIKYGVD
jgi:hypothetical protein